MIKMENMRLHDSVPMSHSMLGSALMSISSCGIIFLLGNSLN